MDEFVVVVVVVVLTIPIDIAPDASSLVGSFNTPLVAPLTPPRVGGDEGWVGGSSNRVRLSLFGGAGGGGRWG